MPLTLRQGILDTERPDPSLLEPAEAGSNSFPCSYGCGSSKSQALDRQKSPLISSCLLHNCDMGQKSPGLPAVSGDFLKKLLLFFWVCHPDSCPQGDLKTKMPAQRSVRDTHPTVLWQTSAFSSPPHQMLGTQPHSSPSLSSFVPSSQSGSEWFHCTTATLALERCN